MANKTDGMTSPGDDCCQKPQCPEDKQAPGYENDVPITSWLRNGDACTKPSFDHQKKG